jgi:hypothetical protein
VRGAYRSTLPSAGRKLQFEEQADVAQLVEQLIRNQQVVSSSLTVGSSLSPRSHPLCGPLLNPPPAQEPSRARNHVVHGLSTNFFIAVVDRARLSTHTLGIIALEERMVSEYSSEADEFAGRIG